MPWWGVAILGWIGMVSNIQNGYGKRMDAYRAKLNRILDGGNPSDLYALYKQFEGYQDSVARKATE